MYKALIVNIPGLHPSKIKDWLPDLPNLAHMQSKGIWGRMNCTLPAGNPQSWISMMSGKNPASYGIWGTAILLNQASFDQKSVTFQDVSGRVKSLFALLPGIGQKIAVIGLPEGWGAFSIPGGFCITSSNQEQNGMNFLPPNLDNEILAYDKKLFDELHTVAGNPQTYRRRDEIYCELARFFLNEKQCDYVQVELSGLEKTLRQHVLSDQETKSYYIDVDACVGSLLSALDSDTVLMITSPYSLETARGVFRVNEWLIQEGYLQVDSPTQVTSIDKVKVVWSKTSAWYSNNLGGLYFTFQKDSGKKEGRQANILHYSSEIAKKLESLQSPDGEQINLRAIPLDLYQSGAYQHLGPGLILEDAYGHWGLEDQIGYGVSGLFSRAGNLPCVPTSQGYFCLAGSTAPSRGEVDNLSLLNVAPTVFEVLRLEPRLDFEAGTIFSLPAKEDHPLAAVEIAGENKDDEATIRSRLEMLGY